MLPPILFTEPKSNRTLTGPNTHFIQYSHYSLQTERIETGLLEKYFPALAPTLPWLTCASLDCYVISKKGSVYIPSKELHPGLGEVA